MNQFDLCETVPTPEGWVGGVRYYLRCFGASGLFGLMRRVASDQHAYVSFSSNEGLSDRVFFGSFETEHWRQLYDIAPMAMHNGITDVRELAARFKAADDAAAARAAIDAAMSKP